MRLDQDSVLAVVVTLLRVARKLTALDRRAFDFGTGELLHPTEAHTIDAIGSGEGSTVTELARHFGVTKGAASQMAAKLHRRGYVAKSRSPADGKEIILTLSDKGKIAYAGHRAFHASMDRALVREFSGMSVTRLRDFLEDLNMVEAHVDRYTERG